MPVDKNGFVQSVVATSAGTLVPLDTLDPGKREIEAAKRVLARNLRRLRLERVLSQDDLAAEAGLRQAFTRGRKMLLSV